MARDTILSKGKVIIIKPQITFHTKFNKQRTEIEGRQEEEEKGKDGEKLEGKLCRGK